MVTEVRASHILVDDKAKADDILKKILEGEKFAKAARRFSSCPSGENGGDLGFFSKGMMVPEFETAAFSAKTGSVIGPIKTQFGYHLIHVTEKK